MGTPYDDVTVGVESDDSDGVSDHAGTLGTARALVPAAAMPAVPAAAAPAPFNRQQIDLIKQTIAAGATDLELDFFLEVCRLTGLNPFQRQIYAIMRNVNERDERGQWHQVKRMTIQTGIDGYRLIAARTCQLAGIDDAIFDTEEGDHPGKATVTVWRFVGGHRVPFTATARWREYVQTDKAGNPIGMWAKDKMPWAQLAKCGEALALRRGFPAELSGVYTHEEMDQADNEREPRPIVEQPARRRISDSYTPLGEQGDQPAAPQGRAKLTITTFCHAVQDELHITPRQAMEMLGVKSLAGVNLDTAMLKLHGLIGVAQQTPDERAAVAAIIEADPDPDPEPLPEPDPSPAPDSATSRPYHPLGDLAWRARADRIGYKDVAAIEMLLAKAGLTPETATREECERALHAEEMRAAAVFGPTSTNGSKSGKGSK